MRTIPQHDADTSAAIARREIAPTGGELGTAQRTPDYIVDVRFLLVATWEGKWIILAAALIGLFYGAWKLHTYVPLYDAYMIVAPGGSHESAPQYGSGAQGAARYFGISVPQTAKTSTFDRLELLIGSITLAERLQQTHGLMQRVFSGSWDEGTGKWIQPTDVRFVRGEEIKRFFNRPTWQEPSLESLAAYLVGALYVSSDQGKGAKRIAVRHQDREYALFLLKTVYEEADTLLREQDRAELLRQKAYVSNQLNEVTLSEGRVVLIQLLSNIENKLMLLGGGLSYAAHVLEPPRASLQLLPPATGRIVGTPAALGLFLGIMIVLLIQLFRPQ
jgi:hypothetical protein